MQHTRAIRWTLTVFVVISAVACVLLALVVVPPVLDLVHKSSAAMDHFQQRIESAHVDQLVERVHRLSQTADTLIENATVQLSILPNITARIAAMVERVLLQAELLALAIDPNEIAHMMAYIQERDMLSNTAVVLNSTVTIMRSTLFANATTLLGKLSDTIELLNTISTELQSNGITVKL